MLYKIKIFIISNKQNKNYFYIYYILNRVFDDFGKWI